MSLSWQKSFHAAKAVRWAAFAYIRKRGMIATVYVTKNFGFRRGEIYFADLDPHYGSEQGGKRPVIVIQNNTGNKFAPTVIVAAVTSKVSKKPNQPTHVLIEQNPAFSRPSVVLLEQIFTIDKERIQRLLGQTTPDEMYQINEALMNSLDLNGGR
jgi:mRNA interferase MazF